jgi:methionyl-tRNA formyltransferase
MLNVLLVGGESAGIQALRAIARTGHRIVAVLTTSRREHARGATVADVATHFGYPVWPAKLVKDPALGDRLREEGVDLLLNVHSLFVIHAEVLRAARIGSFNLHPGPLPEYAGLNAPSWAIYRGERRHGVTVHWMAPGIDTGPIAYQSTFEISEEDTGLSVSARCVRHGLPLIERLLDTASTQPSQIPSIEQDFSRRRYFGADVPYGGKVHWTVPARELVDLVRACDYFPLVSPWGYPATRIEDRVITIVKASRTGEPCSEPPGTVGRTVDGAAMVATADEWILVHRLRVDEKYVPADDVLAPGQRLANGDEH